MPAAVYGRGKAREGLSRESAVLKVGVGVPQVRVQAGARVRDVVEELRPHRLTLQNYASIREQSIGGFIQVPPTPSAVLSRSLQVLSRFFIQILSRSIGGFIQVPPSASSPSAASSGSRPLPWDSDKSQIRASSSPLAY
jgi:hypothetical protein